MMEKKSLRERYKVLTKIQKVQVIIASLLTIFLLVGIPSFAWFSLTSRIETLTKVRAPISLEIKSGHSYSIQHLDLSDINVLNADNNGDGHKDYIFSVKAGENISEYDIQLAHTTNIPFTYEIYRASELENSTNHVATFDYYDEASNQTIVYYYGYASNSALNETSANSADDAKLTMTNLNPDSTSVATFGRTLADRTKSETSIYSQYSQYSNSDKPEIYAVPLYSKCSHITKWHTSGDYFILRISWNISKDNTAFSDWNAAGNNKETDMIYISAKVSQ